MRKPFIATFLLVLSVLISNSAAEEKIAVLLVDGHNNHKWQKTSPIIKAALESCGHFEVTVATAPKRIEDGFAPEFNKYDVVVSNYNGPSWNEATRKSFEEFVKSGKGFVSVHAADNSFNDWPDYNRMIGLGGWGGRNEKSGPYVYYEDDHKLVRDTSKGRGGGHGPQHEFAVVIRDTEHPITKGLPRVWMHTKDELYQQLRGPADQMKVLATALAATNKRGTGRHEPMLMAIDYGKGRVFHTTLGHDTYSMECVGFVATLQRGTEWAATGKVTLPVPKDFPSATKASVWKPEMAAAK